MYRIYICGGPNCGPKGSLALLDNLVEELRMLGIDSHVSVTATGCQNHCESGPTVVVYPGPVFYQQVDRARLKRIASEHLLNGRPVHEYLWTGPRSRKSQKLPAFPNETGLKGIADFSGSAAKPRPRKAKRSYEDVDDFKW